MTAEQGVVFVVNNLKLTTGLQKQRRQGLSAGTVHRVENQAQTGFLNRRHINLPGNTVQIIVNRIKLFHPPGFEQFFIRRIRDLRQKRRSFGQ